MRVRAASEDDWDGIWPIWHAVVAAGDTYVWLPSTPEPAARALWMLPPPAALFVGEDDGSIVATAKVVPNQPGLGDHVCNASFMVDPTRHGRGFGRRLAEVVIERAREAGYRGMQFNAVVASNDRAVALWRGLGFDTVGRIPDGFRHAGLGPVDLLVMYRAL